MYGLVILFTLIVALGQLLMACSSKQVFEIVKLIINDVLWHLP